MTFVFCMRVIWNSQLTLLSHTFQLRWHSTRTSCALITTVIIFNSWSIHGRKSRGGEQGRRVPPRIWSAGDANTNCPPDFVMFLNANRHIFALQCSELYMSKLIVMARIQISNTSAYYSTAGLAWLHKLSHLAQVMHQRCIINDDQTTTLNALWG